MSKITMSRPTGNDGEYNLQPIRLERGVYGAMFARYTDVKMRAKYQSTELEPRIGLGFVITHAANEKPLPKFSEAFKMPGTKLFWDPKKGTSSTMFSFWRAILSGKYTPEQLITMKDDDFPDLDEIIGYPVQLLIEPAATADKNGVIANNITEFLTPTVGMKRAVAAIYKTMETGYTTDANPRLYMKTPKASYEDGSGAGSAPAPDAADDGIGESGIPF